MHHPIDPKIDCVFKALPGSEDNRALLIHFLNAMLGETLPSPVADVVILKPYNERKLLDDKLAEADRLDRQALDASSVLYACPSAALRFNHVSA